MKHFPAAYARPQMRQKIRNGIKIMAEFVEEQIKKKITHLKELRDDGFLSDKDYNEEADRLKEEFIKVAFDKDDIEEDKNL